MLRADDICRLLSADYPADWRHYSTADCTTSSQYQEPSRIMYKFADQQDSPGTFPKCEGAIRGLFIAVILLFMLAITLTGQASEVDSFTSRHSRLDDVAGEINAIINKRIEEGVDKANANRTLVEEVEGIVLTTQKADCDRDELYTELRKSIFQSYTASWGLKGYDLDLQLRELLTGKTGSVALHDSIYRDISVLEGFSLNLKELTDVVNINGQLVGLDKLGHFFAQGWQYFEISREHDGSLKDALAWGKGKEEGLYGYTTTGIFSYADLVANFNGWRFWNRVLLHRHDPVNGFFARLVDRPYVTCNLQVMDSIRQLRLVHAWEINREFDLRDYIDGAWDEAINCDRYASPDIEAKVLKRVAEVAPGYVCPASIVACVRAKGRYGKFAPRLLHPACLNAGEVK